MGMGYATIEFVKTLAQMRHDDLGFSNEEDYNRFIGQLIEHASALVDEYCSRSFEEPPQTIKLVTALIVVNMLHIILQRKINPMVQTTSFVVKTIEGEAFTEGLKEMLNPYKRLEVQKG